MDSDDSLPPGVEVIPAAPEQEPVLANRLELYAHDLSGFFDLRLGPDGRFGYPRLPLYWREEGRLPFLVKVDGGLAGFVLVSRGSRVSGDPRAWDVAEFFVARPFRKRGIGAAVPGAVGGARAGGERAGAGVLDGRRPRLRPVERERVGRRAGGEAVAVVLVRLAGRGRTARRPAGLPRMSPRRHPPYAERIRAARERAGLTREAVWRRLEINDDWYRDVEWDDSEVMMTLSLAQVTLLADLLGTRADRLLEDGCPSPRSSRSLGFVELAARAEARMAELEMSVEEFGERVGWEIGTTLDDPERFWLWNADGLQDLCAELGLCWLDALPQAPPPPHVPRSPWTTDLEP